MSFFDFPPLRPALARRPRCPAPKEKTEEELAQSSKEGQKQASDDARAKGKYIPRLERVLVRNWSDGYFILKIAADRRSRKLIAEAEAAVGECDWKAAFDKCKAKEQILKRMQLESDRLELEYAAWEDQMEGEPFRPRVVAGGIPKENKPGVLEARSYAREWVSAFPAPPVTPSDRVLVCGPAVKPTTYGEVPSEISGDENQPGLSATRDQEECKGTEKEGKPSRVNKKTRRGGKEKGAKMAEAKGKECEVK